METEREYESDEGEGVLKVMFYTSLFWFIVAAIYLLWVWLN